MLALFYRPIRRFLQDVNEAGAALGRARLFHVPRLATIRPRHEPGLMRAANTAVRKAPARRRPRRRRVSLRVRETLQPFWYRA
jgi:hypothetical protein